MNTSPAHRLWSILRHILELILLTLSLPGFLLVFLIALLSVTLGKGLKWAGYHLERLAFRWVNFWRRLGRSVIQPR